MAKKSIEAQFKESLPNISKIVEKHMTTELSRFGELMVDSILPDQTEFRNLTGNTLTSFAYGVYVNGVLHTVGFFGNGSPPIRIKLSKGEIVRDFEDYDGNIRSYFKADIDTDRGWGDESSFRFLAGYKPKGKYSLVFTTGTEYSSYLENVLNLNVLSDSIESVRTELLKSFKPI